MNVLVFGAGVLGSLDVPTPAIDHLYDLVSSFRDVRLAPE